MIDFRRATRAIIAIASGEDPKDSWISILRWEQPSTKRSSVPNTLKLSNLCVTSKIGLNILKIQ